MNIGALALAIQTIFIPIALPCSGKTSAFNEMKRIDCIGENIAVASPDLIREKMHPGYEDGLVPFSSIDNREVFDASYERMTDLLAEGWDVWFDAVNTWSMGRQQIYDEAETVSSMNSFGGAPFQYVLIVMDVPFDEVVKRNRKYRQGHRCVPTEVLENMRDQMEEDISFPAENHEIWKIMWRDGKWMPSDGSYLSPLCSCLIGRLNDRFS